MGTIVVDNHEDVAKLRKRAAGGRPQQVLLRIGRASTPTPTRQS